LREVIFGRPPLVCLLTLSGRRDRMSRGVRRWTGWHKT